VEDKGEINRWSPVESKIILVPTDLRPESMIALRYALTLAKQFDANLTLLHVLQEPYSSDTEVEPGVEGSLDPRERQRGTSTGFVGGGFALGVSELPKLFSDRNSLRTNCA
jgi:hypothetical protein